MAGSREGARRCHGRLPKQRVDVLHSPRSVIEVGVDVPTDGLMVIESRAVGWRKKLLNCADASAGAPMIRIASGRRRKNQRSAPTPCESWKRKPTVSGSPKP